VEGLAKKVPPIVVVRPQSGYANRLQAITSAWILAEKLNAALLVDWIPDPDVAPVGLDAVLDPSLCAAFNSSAHAALSELGIAPGPLAHYLHFDEASEVVTLAGMDRGEQQFMPELRHILESRRVRGIVISAGGKYTLDGGSTLTSSEEAVFRRQRKEIYGRLLLHPEVEVLADRAVAGRESFQALHLRYSDRAIESPWTHRVKSALIDVKGNVDDLNLFIASDSPKAKVRWLEMSADLGWKPWTMNSSNLPREDPASAWEALVDWRILTRAHSLIYFRASSFAEEAAVAGGSYERSRHLTPSLSRRMWMQMRKHGGALRSYPQRQDWW